MCILWSDSIYLRCYFLFEPRRCFTPNRLFGKCIWFSFTINTLCGTTESELRQVCKCNTCKEDNDLHISRNTSSVSSAQICSACSEIDTRLFAGWIEIKPISDVNMHKTHTHTRSSNAVCTEKIEKKNDSRKKKGIRYVDLKWIVAHNAGTNTHTDKTYINC